MVRILMLIICAALSACQAKHMLVRPGLEEEGAVYLYMRPLPPDAARLSFTLKTMEAIRENGTAIPLELRFTEINDVAVSRERFLAEGTLPPGQYAGFRVKAGKATLKGEEGAAALEIAEAPALIDAPFLVRKTQGIVFSLHLRFSDSVSAGFRFTPLFSAEGPPRPSEGAIGTVSSRGSNSVTVFDKVSGRVTGIIPTGREPSGMAISADRRKAYVVLAGVDRVEVLDLLEHVVIDRLQMKAGDAPVEAILTPDGRTLLTANSGSNSVSFIDPVALFETNRVGVGSRPRSVLMDPTGRRAYVFNEFSDTITHIDIPSGTVKGTVATEAAPIRGALNRDRTRLFVIHNRSPYLAVLDPVTLSLLRRIHVGTGATAIAVDPRTDRIYVARGNAPSIDVYDTSVLLPIDFLPSAGDVSFLAVESEQNLLCSALSDLNMVRMVRLVGKKATVDVDVGEDPCWISFQGAR